MAKQLYNQPSPLETRIVSKNFAIEGSETLDVYLANDGYKAFRKAKEMTPEAIIEEVKTSGLRGRGGAGFPTGLKWSFVPRTSPKPRVIVVNADESEPGTCKDRLLMEYDPHQMIEGILIAGLAVDAHKGLHLYPRRISLPDREDGSRHRRSLRQGLPGQERRGHRLPVRSVHPQRARAPTKCGEETALLDSIEGKRGIPRMKPPFPAVAGRVGACRRF